MEWMPPSPAARPGPEGSASITRHITLQSTLMQGLQGTLMQGLQLRHIDARTTRHIDARTTRHIDACNG